MKKPLVCLLPFILFLHHGQAQEASKAPHEIATALIALCNAEEKASLVKPYDDPSRTDWHYIPKNTRKGLDLRKTNDKQSAGALALLASSMSPHGFTTARNIMKLEGLLAVLEKAPERRDPDKYFVTIFGTPGATGKWSYSFEGHHLSLNYAYEDGELACATPLFLAANPDRVVKTAEGFPPVGTRVLKREKDLAIGLLRALDAEKAVVGKTERDMNEAGKAQAQERRRVGVSAADMNDEQKKKLRALVNRYLNYLPKAEAKKLRQQIKIDELSFAWRGTADPKAPHSYQVVGPTHAIVYYNTQGDSVGTKVNHSHAILRTIGKDFNLSE